MKRLIILIIVLAFGHLAPAQSFALELERQNVVYVGIDNPMILVVEGYKGRDLVVTTDNGKISGDDSHYILNPDHVGRTTIVITVKTSKGLKKIGEKYLRAKCIPPPTPYILGKRSGFIAANMVRAAIAPNAVLEGFEIDAHFAITRFRIIVTRGKAVILDEVMHKDKGVRFCDSPTVLDVLKSVKPGDRLRIENITIVGPGGPISHCEEPSPIDLVLN